MKKRLQAALTAICCVTASFSAIAISAEETTNPYLLPADMGYYYGFIIETDGTELTEEMLPFADDYQFMSLYTFDYITEEYFWGYNEIDYTPSDSTYIVQLRWNDLDYLNTYARQVMLELDCVKDVLLFEYTSYQYGGAHFEIDYSGAFYAVMRDPSVMLEDLDIPELEGMEYLRNETSGSVGYFIGDEEFDSALYAEAKAYVEQASNGEITVENGYFSDIYSFEFLNNYADTLAEKYSEYFVDVCAWFEYLEEPTSEPSPITSAVSAWQTAGDHNADGEVNSNDAADLLVQAAQEGVAEASETAVSPDSDVNLDGVADSTDAAYILQYAALKGSGADADWVEILK